MPSETGEKWPPSQPKVAYNCKFVGIVEKDNRHSPADFGKEKQRAPADLKDLLDKVEFIEYRRRDFEEKAMVQELVRRIRQ